MGPTHFYGARAEKPPQKADFAMKQTNICRLSGDITRYILQRYIPCTALSGSTMNLDHPRITAGAPASSCPAWSGDRNIGTVAQFTQTDDRSSVCILALYRLQAQ